MRLAGLVVWQAHQAAAARVRPGATTRELDQAVEQVLARTGAVPLFKGVPGKVPFPASTCTSINEEVVHGIPADRVLQEGDIVGIDIGCKFRGWCGDSAATYAVGRVGRRVEQLLSVTQQALDLSIELLGRCRLWSEVARQVHEFVRAAGFSIVEQFVGHGIGREMHEPPQVPNFDSDAFRKEQDFVLRPGLVLAIEPMVNMGRKEVKCRPDHWTYVTADGQYSAHFEHTVALMAAGPVRLTGPPQPEECGLELLRGGLRAD
jgi:methionyl aminopeptidase